MSKPKLDLSAALAKNKGSQAEPEPAASEAPPAAPQAQPKAKTDRGTSIQGFFPPAVKFTLDELRLKRQRELGRRVTIQELQDEAINELFKKYGLPDVAPVRET